MNKFSLSAVIAGSLVGFLIKLMGISFFSALVFFAFKLEKGSPSIIAMILLILSCVVTTYLAFYHGGYIAAKLSPSEDRWTKRVHGLASFALTAAVCTHLILSHGATICASVGEKLGLSAGASVSINAIMSEMAKMQIITEMKIFEGKAVTQMALPENGKAINPARPLKKASESAKKLTEDEEVKKKAQEAAKVMRKILAFSFFGFFGWLVLGTIASSHGARREEREKV